MTSIWKLLITIMVISLLPVFTANAQDVELTVVANGKGIPLEMSLSQLKSIMRGEKLRWPDGNKVIIALLKTNTSIGSTTSKLVYNMTPNELNKYWLALVFQGKADAPNFFSTESELEDFVAQTNGAIGVATHPAAGSKIILIDGKKTL